PFPSAKADQEDIWTRLILTYARHRRLFTLSADDGETTSSPWREVLTNERIRRRLNSQQVNHLIKILVERGAATYEPPKQLSSVLILWRKPEEWAEILHSWVGAAS
ncbi:492_t:CDS:2, partial [Acaulospora colombiana]